MSVIRPYFQPELDTARDLHLTRKEPRGEDLNGPAPHRAGSERRSRGVRAHLSGRKSSLSSLRIVPLTEGKEEGSPHRIRSASGRCYGTLWLAATVTSRWENPEHPVLTGHARAWAAPAGASLLTPRSPSARPGPAGGSDRSAPGPRQLLNILNIDTGQP